MFAQLQTFMAHDQLHRGIIDTTQRAFGNGGPAAMHYGIERNQLRVLPPIRDFDAQRAEVCYVNCGPTEIAVQAASRGRVCFVTFGDATMEQDALQGNPNTLSELYRRTNFSVRLPNPEQSATFLNTWQQTAYAKITEVSAFRSSVAGGYAYLTRPEVATFDVALIYRPHVISQDSHELKALIKALQGTLQDITGEYSLVVVSGPALSTGTTPEMLDHVLKVSIGAQSEGRIVVGYAKEDWSGRSRKEVAMSITNAAGVIVDPEDITGFFHHWMEMPNTFDYAAGEEDHVRAEARNVPSGDCGLDQSADRSEEPTGSALGSRAE